MDRSLMTRAAIGLALALGACGGSVSPDTTTSTGGTTGSGSAATGSSGVGTTATTGGDTVGTTGTASTSSSSSTTSSSTIGSGTGSVGSTSTGVGVGQTSTTTGTTTSTTTGACDFSGAGGAGGAGGANGAAPAGSSTPGAPAPPQPASDAGPAPMTSGILLRLADFPPIQISSGTGSTSVATTGGGPDPNTQYIVLGTAPITCGAPYASGTCGTWQVSIGIPPQDFRVGVFPLHCSNLISFASFTAPSNGGTDCPGGGGGSFDQGTLEILSLTNVDAIVRLSSTSRLFDFDADGVYRVLRCIK